ncbi:hypothetical protein KDU71_19630 [Carboxylicivirga sediminis]|uniref:Uncharacterized protein n=1 Tax=Carboxylicivirga sediminis TaxID=2006564 RepID=A0A941J1E7_9BACT|nr:hypothetical protein [Carboxylicivirga sediminis]MBR8537792.1 hypothetical protein [Carboxylicivirga sediminis]
MKKTLPFPLIQTVTIIVLVLISAGMQAQSLVEQTGGVKTSFTITSSGIELPITAQAMVKRGISKYDYRSSFDSGYGYGYGMQTWRLEFTSTSGISEKHIPKEGSKKRRYYQCKLYDTDDQCLLDTQLELGDVIMVSNGDLLQTYSINLNSIPIILLEKTKEVQIDKVWEK